MKKKLITLLKCCLVAFVVAGCSTKPKAEALAITNISTQKADMTNYDIKSESNNFYDLTFEQFETLLNEKGTGIVYLGSPGCPYCLAAAPLLNDLVKEYDTFAYSLSFADDAQIMKFETDYFKDFLSEDEVANGLQIPHVIIIKDGKILRNHLGTVPTHNAHERDMNDTEKKELTGIYQEMIDLLK